jgi:alpha-tubulin suppressor-like RCC1 family protein
VFAFGKNADGQCGTGVASDEPAPVCEIAALAGRVVRAVACGFFHTIAIVGGAASACGSRCACADAGTGAREVVTWGWGENHQLGHGDTVTRPTPAVVAALRGVPIEEVSAGAYHSLARTSDGRVFAWGTGQYGQLGIPGASVQPTPAEVPMAERALRVQAGWWHSVALCGIPPAADAAAAAAGDSSSRDVQPAALRVQRRRLPVLDDGDDAGQAAGPAGAGPAVVDRMACVPPVRDGAHGSGC